MAEPAVRRCLAPAWWPGLALVVGVSLAARLDASPVTLLWLVALGASLRRPAGTVVAALSLGLLQGSLVVSGAGDRAPEAGRPVEALVEPVDSWRAGSWGWSVRVRTVWWRQGSRLEASRQTFWLSLAGEESPPEARRLRVRGRLEASAELFNEVPTPPRAPTLQVKSRRLVAAAAPPPWSQRLRAWVERRLALPGCAQPGTVRPGRALMRALLLGDPGCLEPDTLRGLRRVGLGHLLAVSGLHVGLLVVVVSLATAPLPRRLAGAILGVSLLAYLIAVGGRASLLRALLMLAALACARASSRPIASLNALALVGAGLALLDPRGVSELGFRLSFAAVAGILLLAVPWMRGTTVFARGHQGPRRAVLRIVLGGLAVTLSAQLLTLPFVAHAFSFVSPSAVLFNLVAVPWTAVALGLVLPCAILALAGLAGLAAVDGLLDLLAAPYGLVTAVPASGWVAWPLGWPLPPGPVTVAIAALAFVARRRLAILVLALCVGAAAATVEAPRGPEVVLLDVGQGDALLLRDGGATVLVDGGGAPARDFGGRVLMPALARLGVRRIELAIVSHGDVDHCGGVVDLARRIAVDEIWLPPGLGRASCGERLHEVAGDRLRVVTRGVARSVGDARYRVLWPPQGSRWRGNDASLVIRATVAGVRVLLTGDIETRAEHRLVSLGPLHADLLKVPHHGSRTSSSPRLLRAVAPRAALLSAGRGNRYGHPHAETLERLRNRGIVTWRSDRHGRVVFELAGPRGWRVRTSASPGSAPRALD